jgi:hypothetical protein
MAKKGFDLNGLLAQAEKKEEKKGSKVPVISVDKITMKLVDDFIVAKEAVDNATAEMKLKEAELLEKVTPIRTGMCRNTYVPSVAVEGLESEQMVNVVWSANYCKMDRAAVEQAKTILQDRFDAFFNENVTIALKDGIGDAELTEVIKAVGQDRFLKFFQVTREVKPMRQYTEQFYKDGVFTADEKAQLATVAVQYKPAVKTK